MPHPDGVMAQVNVVQHKIRSSSSPRARPPPAVHVHVTDALSRVSEDRSWACDMMMDYWNLRACGRSVNKRVKCLWPTKSLLTELGLDISHRIRRPTAATQAYHQFR